MKTPPRNSGLFKQRITLMLAMLFCLFISSVAYIPENAQSVSTEKKANPSQQDQDQTYLDVAVDAVVPFVVHISHSVLHLIYEVVHFEGNTFVSESAVSLHPSQFAKVLFERIISTKGP